MPAAFSDDWSLLSQVPLGDPRRNRRLIYTIEGFAEKPSGCVTQVFDEARDIKGTYRLLERSSEWSDTVGEVLREGCLRRIATETEVLAIQDTTHLCFQSSPANGEDGFWLHSLVAATLSGVPLGILWQRLWQRDPETKGKKHLRREKLIGEKESQRWLDAAATVSGNDWPDDVGVTVVGDRESDIYELFAAPRPDYCHLLVRAAHDRRVEDFDGTLFDVVGQMKRAGKRGVYISRRPDRAPRKTTVAASFAEVVIRRPKNGKFTTTASSVKLWVVAVNEVTPLPEQSPISWVLLSTRPVTCIQEAWQQVDYYQKRWLIERFHYGLKSCCKVQDSQLRSAQSLHGLMMLATWVAWRLLAMTYLGRENPDLPATTLFLEIEWQAAYMTRHKGKPLPSETPTIGEVIRWIGCMGGHMGRKRDGPPGVKVLTRGLIRLHDIVLGMSLMNPSILDLGNA